MATKKTKTIKVKSYTYDFSKDGLTDSYKTIALTKYNNMHDWEQSVISDSAVDTFFKKMQNDIDMTFANLEDEVAKKYKDTRVEKKPNVFKRFWNWITRKK